MARLALTGTWRGRCHGCHFFSRAFLTSKGEPRRLARSKKFAQRGQPTSAANDAPVNDMMSAVTRRRSTQTWLTAQRRLRTQMSAAMAQPAKCRLGESGRVTERPFGRPLRFFTSSGGRGLRSRRLHSAGPRKNNPVNDRSWSRVPPISFARSSKHGDSK